MFNIHSTNRWYVSLLRQSILRNNSPPTPARTRLKRWNKMVNPTKQIAKSCNIMKNMIQHHKTYGTGNFLHIFPTFSHGVFPPFPTFPTSRSGPPGASAGHVALRSARGCASPARISGPPTPCSPGCWICIIYIYTYIKWWWLIVINMINSGAITNITMVLFSLVVQ